MYRSKHVLELISRRKALIMILFSYSGNEILISKVLIVELFLFCNNPDAVCDIGATLDLLIQYRIMHFRVRTPSNAFSCFLGQDTSHSLLRTCLFQELI